MNATTDDEVRAFEGKNRWATGICLDDGAVQPYYDCPESDCIQVKFPETPRRAAYFARMLSTLNLEGEEYFEGGLLWLTLWTIGSPQLEKVGWNLVEKMRLAFGETRPIGVAPGHWFRSDEFVELNAFLLPCFLFGWDAIFFPSGQDYFVHISHDEYWTVVAKTKAIYDSLFQQLHPLAPEKAHPNIVACFCRARSF
jgi:hypothetical protein